MPQKQNIVRKTSKRWEDDFRRKNNLKSNTFHSLLIILFLLLFVYAFCFVSKQLYLMVYDGNIILKVKEREYKTRSEILTIYCMHFGVS